MKILDMTAGNRAVWFDKKNPLVTFIDRRPEVKPDIVCDSTSTDFPDRHFDLIVFDPPHVNAGKNSNTSKTYGHHTTAQILSFVEGVNKEAHRVSKQGALMVFKWNDHDIKLHRILKLLPRWTPLCGHITKNGPGSRTYWCLLLRKEADGE